ncbi:MAG: hypothetical protein UR90_C0006G0014 [Parcubacteria group bacterium GW2011_GWC1_35_8]|uniref:Transcriptional repressor PaaX-like central Cas2-like domain-containing protein n=3 Tax=Candidatus Nomuraibacteriota TaxID=1752729 RepID=A0A1F6YWX4_9BACT|nr:MAG: hypothetical protein UR90_C0006G0014 [Parcubacteria group bacterium GW2011_GWC1_35_8]KKP88485.1 MAG: hypothetical protein UR91_C0017G0009 [Candidatus Nomurabacteria bacterium GW2011_GWC2_35_8]OGJ04728.1 MAG: hypothetical protein A2238_01020 [Candidatus Nomurabacteria bacterium RIFOXYA2_FULL_35_9]OGJ06620.1 MAG: hypothetical protein A2192_00785 [Candidatus Nomurabacteria bacterium RIFOXYA1_FULL_35_17]OGJ10770.1 MAG: hypothetical protein A2456_02975 [Candidatus Nomurabacteria bacterium RI
MKGEIIYKIFNLLGDEVIDYVDFANSFLQAGYGATSNKIRYEFSKIQNKRINLQLDKQKMDKLKKYLSKLKSEGLIFKNDLNQIYLSEKGKHKLNNFQNSFSLNKDLYKSKLGNKVVVISYDIPVSFNRERNILRGMLQMLDFNLVHKSVWVGKVELPERFITDLSKLGILDYVEILEVTKNGTLKSKS